MLATIYYTSDMHSYLYDTDYIHPGKSQGGYFQLARHFDPEALVIDGGDVLQGSPLARQVSKRGFRSPVQSEAMNAAGVKVFVPGNHDFNFGYEVFKQFVSLLDAELVCANLKDRSGEIKIKPWYVYTGVDGIRAGVVGVVTEYVNVWEDAQNLGPLEILDSVSEASAALKELKSQNVAYTLCVYHGGYEENPVHTEYQENRANELACLGFDVLLTAHQHTRVEPVYLGSSLTLQCASNATFYSKIELSASGIQASLLHCGEGAVFKKPALDAVKKRYEPFQQEILVSLEKVIGKTEAVLEDSDKLKSAMHGASLADFFNKIQLDFTGADISCVSLFNHPRSLGPTVRAGDVLAAYPFPNTLVVLEVTGSILKTALERCASYFMLEDGEIRISEDFLVPKVEHYNYDYYQNLEYGFSIGNQIGQRVVKLCYQGKDLLASLETKLTLVMNNYRATGTGGYEVFLSCPVIKHEKREVQDLLFDTFAHNQLIPVPPPSCFFVRP